MAEDKNTSIEDIALNLKTNFDTALDNGLKAFTQFHKNVVRSSGAVETAVTKSYRSVTSSLDAMLSVARTNITKSLGLTTEAMRTIQKDTQNILKSTNDSIKQTESLIEKSKKSIDKIMSNASSDKGKNAQMDLVKTRLGNQLQEIMESTINKTGTLAANVSNTLTSVAKDNLRGLRDTANGLKSIFVSLEVSMENFKNSQTAMDGKRSLDDLKEKRKELQKQLKEQLAIVVEAERQMEDARKLYQKQTDPTMKQQQGEQLRKTIDNVAKAHESFRMLEKDLAGLSSKIDSSEGKLKQFTVSLKESLTEAIKPEEFKNKFEAVLTGMENQLKMASMRMRKAFNAKTDELADLNKSLDSDVAGLKEMLETAKQLQDTGFVNTEKEQGAIKKILAEYSEFKNQIKEIKREAKSLFDFEKFDNDFGKLKNNLKNVAQTIKQEFSKISDFKADGADLNKIENAKSVYDNINKLENELVKEREKIQTKIIDLEKRTKDIRLRLVGETNKQIIAMLQAQESEFIRRTRSLKGALAASATPDTDGVGNQINIAAEKTIASIKKIADEAPAQLKKVRGDIESLTDKMREKFEDLSKKRFISSASVSEFKSQLENMKRQVVSYKQNIVDLEKQIDKVKRLGKAGLMPNSRAMVENLKKTVDAYKVGLKEVNDAVHRTQSKFEQLHNKASKTMMGRSMEMIRNFRWQVAAVIYLVTKAANAVKKTIGGILEEIQRFRMDSMVIAAGVSNSMLGDMGQNFDKALSYSKNLMLLMQREAARTILELEDMSMLVKTMTQAGIVPDSAEDVRKIATIGTAIKTLTEGMANAGVQMRQELYAVIQGRQRATDQLQMFFKMQGINIEQLIKEGNESGKDMIDALSEALQPFEEMNTRLADEYVTQKNTLKENLRLIKLMGAETFFKDTVDMLKKINAMLYDQDLGKLTETGEKFALILHQSLSVLKSIGQAILDVFRIQQTIFSELGKVLYGVASAFSFGKKTAEELKNEVSGITIIVVTIKNIMAVIRTLAHGIVTLIKATMMPLRAMLKMTSMENYKIFTSPIETLKRLKKLNSEIGEDFLQAGWDAYDGFLKPWQDLDADLTSMAEASISSLKGTFEDISPFKLPFEFDIYGAEYAKMENKIKQNTLGSLSGPAKFEQEAQYDLDGIKGMDKEIAANIAKINEEMAKYQFRQGEQAELIKKQLNEKLAAQYEMLDKVKEYTNAVYAERNKKVAEWKKKELEAAESARKAYKDMLLNLKGKPETKAEGIEKRYEGYSNQLQKWGATAEYTASELEVLWDAWRAGLDSSLAKNLEDINEEFEQMAESLRSHRDLNPFQQIDNELGKVLLKVKKHNDFSDKQKEDLEKLIELYKTERKEIERNTQAIQAMTEAGKLKSLKADIIGTSKSTFDQRAAERMKLEVEYQNKMIDLAHRRNEIKRQYFDEDTGRWTDESEHQQEMYDTLSQIMDDTDTLYQYHLDNVQRPFWGKIDDLYAGFYDTLAKTLADGVFEFENFAESVANIFKDLARDITEEMIKMAITDPLKDMALGGLRNMMNPKKKEGAAKTESKDAAEGEEGDELVDTVKTSWESLTDNVVKGFGWLKDTMAEGFKWALDGLKSLFSGSGEGGGGGIGGMLSGAFSTVKGWMGFSEGGMLTEPIVGMGLKSGKGYSFVEDGKPEMVVGNKDLNSTNSGSSLSINIPINVNGDSGNTNIAALRRDLEREVVKIVKNYV